MDKIQDIIQFLEQLAPTAYQEGYDNSGLIVGEPDAQLRGVLLSLDCTEAIVDEAIRKGCNLIVAHHPIVFKGLKKLNGKTYVERTVIKAIKHDIAIYAIHTNLDHMSHGVNRMIANRLGLENTRILAPKTQTLMKLTFFVPGDHAQMVLDALYQTGAGQIGRYSHCSFQTSGTGTFKPLDGADPYLGEVGKLEEAQEQRVEIMFPAPMERAVLSALRESHPYEEVAYYLHALENENQEIGAGMVGELPIALPLKDFLAHLKKSMEAKVIRYTPLNSRPIRRVAVCGGAGSFLLPQALRAKADAFVTADYKYHEFFDAENRIAICDIGHYESEVFTKQLLFDSISKKYTNFALYLSEENTNPVSYYFE